LLAQSVQVVQDEYDRHAHGDLTDDERMMMVVARQMGKAMRRNMDKIFFRAMGHDVIDLNTSNG
jgi:hypothetical protein